MQVIPCILYRLELFLGRNSERGRGREKVVNVLHALKSHRASVDLLHGTSLDFVDKSA